VSSFRNTSHLGIYLTSANQKSAEINLPAAGAARVKCSNELSLLIDMLATKGTSFTIFNIVDHI
jgi:hypothetical protein